MRLTRRTRFRKQIELLSAPAILALSAVAASSATAQSLRQMRMTPAEIRNSTLDNNRIGSSELAGVHTKVLFGDPSKAGFYSILLFVPAHTMIQAHSHRDNRVATVVSGTWQFGYGDHFNTKSLKTLPYSEPGGADHFAQTGSEAVIVQISGFGPTDTRYFDPAIPSRRRKNSPFADINSRTLRACLPDRKAR